MPPARRIADRCPRLVRMARHNWPTHLARKVPKTRDDIRPCVGAHMCLDSIYTSGSATCIHNPATGREADLPQEVPHDVTTGPKHVVIIGAGPAGLEAARVAAVRGHRVTLLEAEDAPGGQVRIAARSQRRRDLIGIIDWRVQQCKKHGVDLRLNTFAEAADILALDPDVVIVATGGVPDAGYPFREQGPSFDVWDVMDDRLKSKQRVLVFDDHGFYPALDAVERLARNGQQVTYVSPERTIGIDVGSMNSPAYLQVFSEFGVEVRLGERLTQKPRIEGKEIVALLRNDYSDRESELVTDAVVVDFGTTPNDEVYVELKSQSTNHGATDLEAWVRGRPQPDTGAGSDQSSADTEAGPKFSLYRIGDAVASRNVHAAVLEGLRVGMGL